MKEGVYILYTSFDSHSFSLKYKLYLSLISTCICARSKDVFTMLTHPLIQINCHALIWIKGDVNIVFTSFDLPLIILQFSADASLLDSHQSNLSITQVPIQPGAPREKRQWKKGKNLLIVNLIRSNGFWGKSYFS